MQQYTLQGTSANLRRDSLHIERAWESEHPRGMTG